MKPTKKSYDDSCSRPNEIMKTPAQRKSKYYINTGSFRHHNNCGSTHPSMAASKENKLSPSCSGFKSQKFLHESSYDGISGTDNDEQSLKNFSKCLSSLANRSVLLISKWQYTSCKRRALEDSLCTAAPLLKKIGNPIFLRGGAAVHRLNRGWI